MTTKKVSRNKTIITLSLTDLRMLSMKHSMLVGDKLNEFLIEVCKTSEVNPPRSLIRALSPKKAKKFKLPEENTLADFKAGQRVEIIHATYDLSWGTPTVDRIEDHYVMIRAHSGTMSGHVGGFYPTSLRHV